jgi:uncharacterized Zn finger protein (UPF0148 family)
MLDRAYARSDFKDGNGTWLIPGERPRTPLAFPSSDVCPKCGSRGWAENTGEVFHCLSCGTWIFREQPAPWRRENNKPLARKYRRREITVTCERCGNEFITHNHNGLVKFCPDCRETARAEHQKITDRERKARKKKVKLAASSDEWAAGCVLRVAEVQSQTKEA